MLLDGIQERQARLLSAQYIGLAEIQRMAGIGDLFDTLMVFENYPGDGVHVEVSAGLRVTGIEGTDATHYPLSLMAVPGDRLHLRWITIRRGSIGPWRSPSRRSSFGCWKRRLHAPKRRFIASGRMATSERPCWKHSIPGFIRFPKRA